jgi:hypothetical protein
MASNPSVADVPSDGCLTLAQGFFKFPRFVSTAQHL